MKHRTIPEGLTPKRSAVEQAMLSQGSTFTGPEKEDMFRLEDLATRPPRLSK